MFKYCFRDVFPELQGGTRELRKIFFDTIPVKQISNEFNNELKVISAFLELARDYYLTIEKIKSSFDTIHTQNLSLILAFVKLNSKIIVINFVKIN